jgi:hypothetical protein
MSMHQQTNLNRPVTLANVCVLAIVLAALAGLSFAGYSLYTKHAYKAKIRAEVPRVFHDATAQRDRLVNAIGSYKRAFGFYPPDHLLSQAPVVVEPITNQLYYELVGCAYDRTQQVYLPNGTSMRLPSRLIREFFGREITNAVDTSKVAQGFLPSVKTETLLEIHDRPDIIMLFGYSPDWEGFDGDTSGFEIGGWEYNSSAPQHNAGSYDLWLNITTAETNIVIRNW